MSLKSNRARRAAWEAGVKHCTFDPEGPGVVRIHLIPPVYHPFRKAESLVILNGYYILPLGYTLAHILSAFIDEVNTYDGRPITEEDETHIFQNTVKAVSVIYPHVRREAIGEDLEDLLDVLFEVARGGKPSVYIEKLSVRSYAPYMAAPPPHGSHGRRHDRRGRTLEVQPEMPLLLCRRPIPGEILRNDFR